MADTSINNHYGMTFASQAEMQAWEEYVKKQLAAAKETPLLSAEEANAEIETLLRELTLM